MATKLTKIQWTEILQNERITDSRRDIKIFQVLFSCPDDKAPASKIGLRLGYKGKKLATPINSKIVGYAKRIAKHYEINFTVRSTGRYQYWDLFFKGWHEKPFYIWQLRRELKEALVETGLTGKEYPEEISIEDQTSLPEGSKRTITINSYERNPKARQQCVNHWKPICSVCGFDFENKYGALGKGFIHVHHLVPVSDVGQTYQIDPIKDLRPVCPNCHSMLHQETPPLTIERLKNEIKVHDKNRRK